MSEGSLSSFENVSDIMEHLEFEGDSIEVLSSEDDYDPYLHLEVGNTLNNLLSMETETLTNLKRENEKLRNTILSLNQQRREKMNRPSSGTNSRHDNVSQNSREYLRRQVTKTNEDSLDRLSRYLVRTAITSFCLAFVLLMLTIGVTEYFNLENAKLERNKFVEEKRELEISRRENDKFRESLIHLKYDENRELHASLSMCYSKKEEFLHQLGVSNEKSITSSYELQMEIRGLKRDLKDNKNLIKALREIVRNRNKEIAELKELSTGSWSWFFKTKSPSLLKDDFPDTFSNDFK